MATTKTNEKNQQPQALEETTSVPQHEANQATQQTAVIDTPLPEVETKTRIHDPSCDKPLKVKRVPDPSTSTDPKRITTKTPDATFRLAPHEELDAETKSEWEQTIKSRPDFKEFSKVVHSVFDCNAISSHPELNTFDNPKFKHSGTDDIEKFVAKNKIPLTSTNAYSLLKYVTEKYVHAKLGGYGAAGVVFDRSALPGVEESYFEQVIGNIVGEDAVGAMERGNFNGIRPLPGPELIWSYWMEEGMLVQTMNAISRRFQNLKLGSIDPLANLTLDPLRPINNLLWAYIQDTQHRLTIARRNYEYEHEYGFHLIGKAIPQVEVADRRSKFLEAFNNLLHRCILFFDEFDNLVRRPDPFKVFVCLQEVHQILTEGSHNQYGDLPTTARVEMMMEQQLLANPVMNLFLGGRPMVAYQEPWMDKVDNMKSLQRWDGVSIKHFYELANHGEVLVSSIRNRPWLNANAVVAGQWAQFFREQIQRYVHAYRAVTEVDLSAKIITEPELLKTIPSELIRRRLAKERSFALARA